MVTEYNTMKVFPVFYRTNVVACPTQQEDNNSDGSLAESEYSVPVSPHTDNDYCQPQEAPQVKYRLNDLACPEPTDKGHINIAFANNLEENEEYEDTVNIEDQYEELTEVVKSHKCDRKSWTGVGILLAIITVIVCQALVVMMENKTGVNHQDNGK